MKKILNVQIHLFRLSPHLSNFLQLWANMQSPSSKTLWERSQKNEWRPKTCWDIHSYSRWNDKNDLGLFFFASQNCSKISLNIVASSFSLGTDLCKIVFNKLALILEYWVKVKFAILTSRFSCGSYSRLLFIVKSISFYFSMRCFVYSFDLGQQTFVFFKVIFMLEIWCFGKIEIFFGLFMKNHAYLVLYVLLLWAWCSLWDVFERWPLFSRTGWCLRTVHGYLFRYFRKGKLLFK